MNKELTEKLFNKYPNLFKQRFYPFTQSSMCWGFDCDDGWYKLIDKLCSSIEKISDKVEVIQVKEKFGGLRFYVINSDKKVEKLIKKAEQDSYKICELCGSRKKVRCQTFESWMQTLCEKCKSDI